MAQRDASQCYLKVELRDPVLSGWFSLPSSESCGRPTTATALCRKIINNSDSLVILELCPRETTLGPLTLLSAITGDMRAGWSSEDSGAALHRTERWGGHTGIRFGHQVRVFFKFTLGFFCRSSYTYIYIYTTYNSCNT